MNQRVLVTGAGGLLGSHVIAALRADYEPIALVRDRSAIPPDIEAIETDLSDPSFPKSLPAQADGVIHLAQAAGYADFPEGAQTVFDVNATSMQRLLNWSVKAGVEHFVHASSGGLYGRGPRPFGEDDPIQLSGPLAFYLATKRAAELLGAAYADIFSVAALRFFFIYGPGQRQSMLMPRLIHRVSEGMPVSLASGDGMKLNPIYADDAAAAAIGALDLQGNHIINVGGVEVLSMREIAETIGAVVGKDPQFKLEDQSDHGSLVADIRRMRELLPQPKKTFRAGIERLAHAQGLKATH